MRKYIIHNQWKFMIFVLFKILNIGILLGYSFLIRDLVNIAFVEKPLEALKDYGIYCIIYSVLLMVAYFISSMLYTRYFNKGLFLLRKDYFDGLLDNSYEDIVKKDSSYYISALTNDVVMISNNYLCAIFIIIDESITLIGAFVCVLLINKTIACIMLFVAVLISIIPIFFKRIMNRVNNIVSNAMFEFTSGVKDVLGGVDAVKTFTAEAVMKEKINGLNKNILLKKISRDDKGTILSSMTSVITNIIKIGIIMLTIYFVTSKQLDIGSVSAILTLSGFFFSPIMSLSNQIACIMGSHEIRKKYFSIMENVKTEKIIPIENGDIEFSHVSYSYNKNRLILKDINLVFEKGKKYLIMGESGSGKSTLLKLLCKMYSNYDGAITIGNADYKDLNELSIYSIATYSHQKTYLFRGSLKENIDINHTNDQKKLDYCIHTCKLTEFINKLPERLDTYVSEEVNKLSEGEKLRICLARALYKDSQILLRDEITASLDSINSMEIENMILDIRDKTVVNVCHKISTRVLMKYDGIVIIENGEVAEAGTYEELRNKSIFNKYITKQQEKLIRIS